jgi:hypothetical protein
VTALESYLTGDILRDRADVAAIEAVLRETALTIAATFRGTHWPYEGDGTGSVIVLGRRQARAENFREGH